MNTVSENLKRIRIERGMTQQQMADLLFVTQQTISNWEKGKAMPAVDRLEDIACRLGVEVYDLVYCYDENRDKLKRKAVVCGIVCVLLCMFWFGMADKAQYMANYRFEPELVYFIAFFIRPSAIFLSAYTLMLCFKLKSRLIIPVKNKIMPAAVRVFIVVFCFSVTVSLIGYFFFSLPVPDIFVLFCYDIVDSGKWIYGFMGMAWALSDTGKSKN